MVQLLPHILDLQEPDTSAHSDLLWLTEQLANTKPLDSALAGVGDLVTLLEQYEQHMAELRALFDLHTELLY